MQWEIVRNDIRFAEIHEIHKNSFLCAFTKYLRGSHNSSAPIPCKLRVILSKNVENSPKELHMLKIESIFMWRQVKQEEQKSSGKQNQQQKLCQYNFLIVICLGATYYQQFRTDQQSAKYWTKHHQKTKHLQIELN